MNRRLPSTGLWLFPVLPALGACMRTADERPGLSIQAVSPILHRDGARLAGTGILYNNHYAGLHLGPNGTIYVGVGGGVVALRDGRSGGS
jgi:hypothetical protein